MGLLGEMSVNFTGNVSGLQSAAGAARGILTQLGSGNFAGAAVTTLAAIAGAAIGVGVSSVQAAGAFQQSMLKVQAYAGLSKQQTDAMSNSILDMAAKLGQSPKAMADAIYPIISSGYSASQALNILDLSAKTAAASGAKMSVVADMLTTSLKASGAPANQAGHYMDMFNKIVSLGKGEVPQYAAVIGKLTLSAGSAKVPFDQMGAALATLTTHGFPSVAQASTSLGNLFNQVGTKVDTLAAHAKKLGINFNENAFKAASFSDKLKILSEVTDGDQGKLLKLLGGSTVALKAFNALSNSSKDLASNMDAMKNSAGATDSAYRTASTGFNASMNRMKASAEVLQIKIGQALLPALTNLTNAVTPMIARFGQWITTGDNMRNVAIALGIIIATLLIPPMVTLAASVIAATWPFLLIGAAIGGLIAIFMHFYQTNAPFKAFIDNIVKAFQQLWSVIAANFIPVMQRLGVIFQSVIMPLLQAVGGYLLSTFKPVWDQLVATFQGQLIPVWNSLVKAIQPLLPALQMAAEGLGLILAAALVIAIAIIGGLIHAFASFLSGIITIFGGVVEVISGAIKIVSGIIAFFADLLTGRWDKLAQDLGTIMDGIGTMFHGAWQIIIGVFQAGIGAVVGFVAGFGQTIIGIVQNLSNVLVGHSIIPDMVNAIVSWFQQLPGRAGAALQAMASTAIGILNGLAASALSAGINIVTQIANGITAGIGAVGNAIGQVTAFIAAHLPHSPAKLGPLRTLPQAGANISKQIGEGMISGIPSIKSAMSRVVAPIMSTVNPGVYGTTASVSMSGSSSTGASGAYGNSHTTIVELDGRAIAEYTQSYANRQARLKLGSKGRIAA